MSPSARKTLGWILAAVFALAMIMGPGPGMYLVNTPTPVLGIPAIYAWGLLWYVVEVGVVVVAYFFVWPRDDDSPKQSA
ncbi:MAG: hypothetical protein RIC55_28825 [Pirellulaceae bacterium]